MKNIFKNIVALVAFSAATLNSGFSVSAQNLPAGTYLESNGIAYAKEAHINGDGTYTVDLHTFVTGEVTQTMESVPVDVVLVLDVSGSMADNVNSYEYTQASHSRIRATDYFDTIDFNNQYATDYFYNYNGNYYQVYVGRGGYIGNRHWFLFFTVNGTRYHINSNGQVVTQEPTNITNNATDLWNTNVTLYTRRLISSTTKIQALKDAVDAFIRQIEHNDWYEDDTNDKRRTTALGNRISIVKFADDSYYNSTAGAESDNAPLTPGNNFNNQGYNHTQVVRGFTATSSTANVNDLISAVDGLRAAGATAADYGMNLARLLINSVGSDPTRANSNKTVVFFTDGEPNHQNGFDNGVASAAIRNSKKIKDVTYGEGDDATHPAVFSVGVFDQKPAPSSNLENFMNYISSNYPAATAYNNGGAQASNTFYMDASGGTAEDLKAIFTAIAHAAGGSGNTEVSGGSSVTVDIVSSSFSVPQGYEDNPAGAVTVLVAPCIGKTNIGGKEYLTFGPEKTPEEYGMGPIVPSISESDNKVSTTGFDYSENWCGPDPTSTSQIQPGYHGFKQIIRFKITVNEDAVGGPNVDTNDADSGIYLEGSDKPLITFNRPTVKLPVQIWLQKQGLRPGDSAVFTLYMCKFTEWDSNQTDIEKQKWDNFTKVVVNYNDMDTNGIVKIVGLDPDYFYRLKEDAWAYGYTYQDGGIQYTVGDNVQNPFVFVNIPKEIKYDEATARNVFKERTAASGGDEEGEGGEGGESGNE